MLEKFDNVKGQNIKILTFDYFQFNCIWYANMVDSITLFEEIFQKSHFAFEISQNLKILKKWDFGIFQFFSRLLMTSDTLIESSRNFKLYWYAESDIFNSLKRYWELMPIFPPLIYKIFAQIFLFHVFLPYATRCHWKLLKNPKISKSQNFDILRYLKSQMRFLKNFFKQCDRVDRRYISNTAELKIIKYQNSDILTFYIIKIFQHFQTSHNFANTMGLCTTRLLTKCKKPHPIIIICFRDTVKNCCLFIKL